MLVSLPALTCDLLSDLFLGIAGGASDPNSGSASMNEVVRSFGAALAAGWKPLRTIVFASWDGEEYGLLGSTEWVEQYLPWLQDSAVAYLNVDVSAQGNQLRMAASPLLNQDLYEITSLVPSPNQTIPGQTVRDVWDQTIRTMGSGSDFTAFQDFAGIPSLDFGFGRDFVNGPVYHYHSNYDSFNWMNNFGDPNFTYHTTASKILGLLTAKLAETPVLALNTTDYAEKLAVYLESVKRLDDGNGALRAEVSTSPDLFTGIEGAISRLIETAKAFDDRARTLGEHLARHHRDHHHRDSLPNPSFSQPTPSSDSEASLPTHWPGSSQRHLRRLLKEIRYVNSKYKYFERQFLFEDGLDGRPWFKHVVFAPGKWTGYAGATFPGLVEALDEGNRTAQERWVRVIEKRIEDARDWLVW